MQLGPDHSLRVHPQQQEQMAAAVARVEAVVGAGRYLHIPYTTLFEYLKVRSPLWRCTLSPMHVLTGAHCVRIHRWGLDR